MKKNDDSEFTYNAKGAIVYRNPMRHDLLEITSIQSRKEKGSIYKVLSVGKFWSPDIPVVTVEERGKPVLFRLPEWYLKWSEFTQLLSSEGGIVFPSFVEFGYIVPEKQYYAEILDRKGNYINPH
jgi:hypothetical protein